MATKKVESDMTIDGVVVSKAVASPDYKTINNPGGGQYTTTSVLTGAIAITLPVGWTNAMMRMTVKIYEYSTNKSFEVNIGGYNRLASLMWLNTSAYIIGNPDMNRQFSVRFGYTAGGKCVVYIGELTSTWSYPQIAVTDVIIGFTGNSATWISGWSIGFQSTAFENVSQTITSSQIGYQSAGATANTLALRDTSGDISARLFRSAFAEQTSAIAATADIAFRNDTSDNYIRFGTLATVRAYLGLVQELLTTSNVAFANVTGAIFTGTNFVLASDRRLKKKIKPLSADLAYQLKPIEHEWRDKKRTGVHVGFLADEVKQINKELVLLMNDGFEGIDYSKIAAINNAAVQDLNKRLIKVESKMDEIIELLRLK